MTLQLTLSCFPQLQFGVVHPLRFSSAKGSGLFSATSRAQSNEARKFSRIRSELFAELLIEGMVGPCGLEPQTSTVSRWRSSQLSYGPTDWRLS